MLELLVEMWGKPILPPLAVCGETAPSSWGTPDPPVGSQLQGRTCGGGGRGTPAHHTQRPLCHRHTHGRTSRSAGSRICSNLSKDPDYSAPDMSVHPPRRVFSGTVVGLFSDKPDTDGQPTDLRRQKGCIPLRGGAIRANSTPKEKRNLLS